MQNKALWLRWSRRDLRERWLQVTAIALIIALGTGVYAGLGSSRPWRQQSYDDSYALLHMYDLRVQLVEGSSVDATALLDAVRGIRQADQIAQAEARLIAPTLVDVPTRDGPVLIPGRILGVDVARGGPRVNGIAIEQGRALSAEDIGQPRAVLEYNFAAYYHLKPGATVQISGGLPLEAVGTGMTPEYFMVISEGVGFKDEGNFAVIMVSLETAQQLTGNVGMANDLVLTLAPGADRSAIQAEIEQAIHRAFPQVGFSFLLPEDDPAHRTLYGDMDGDHQIFMLIAGLFLAGAAFGTFNLALRIVEAQRRQIGIGMALGMPARLLALRPLLVGVQIAGLGVVFGLVIGLGISQLFGKLMRDLMPLPVFRMPFQWGIFAQAAALGSVLPCAATLYPVWRAVRVPPLDAIKTGYLVSRGGGLAPALARIPLPGKSFTQMPLRNLLRAPRRTLLTLLGVAMAITTLVANLGMLDSFLVTIQRSEDEFLQNSPDRMMVTLNTFYPVASDPVQAVRQSEILSTAEPGVIVGGELRRDGQRFEIALELLALDSTLWRPTLVEGQYPAAGEPGILIARKAAHDLKVGPGDTITLWHPRREGLFSFRMVETTLPVTGIHAGPLRYQAFMSLDQAGQLGLAGLTNVLYVNPGPGATQQDVKRALFEQPGVASVKAVADFTRMLQDMMSLLVAFMGVVVIAVLALAFLIAFNSTSINVDERAREIATLFAFGLRVRTVTRMTAVENLIMGLLGTLLGLGLGWGALVWMVNERIETMMPDVHLVITLAPLSLVIALLVGVIVVALTPLLQVRKLARMNLPSTLRVME